MQNSSDDLIDVTHEVGTSGTFLELARKGQLAPVSSLIQKRAIMAADLAQVNAQLRACNNPAALAEFAVWCLDKKKDFGPELKKMVKKCESRRLQILDRMAGIDHRLVQQKQSTEFPTDSAKCVSLVPKVQRPQNSFLDARNKVIDQNITLPHQDICRILDFEFALDDQVHPQYFPDSWVRNFGVKTFTAAYRIPKCRGLVHKMFSTRRHHLGLPKA